MFHIIETLRNYFKRDNLSSDVALHLNVSYWRPYFMILGGKLFGGSVLPVSAASVVVPSCLLHSQ